jgi:ABC-type multidrug transport system ATPase subunit/pSer/pThr/pTyr-binding forkhead associated (FHA) protein
VAASFDSPCLLRLSDRSAQQPIPITAQGLQVGRGRLQNQLVIDDPEMSRLHARLVCEADGRIVLYDSSANGTFVNGQRVSSEALDPGDEVRFGFRNENRYLFQPAGKAVVRWNAAEQRLSRMGPQPSPEARRSAAAAAPAASADPWAGREAGVTMLASAHASRFSETVIISPHEDEAPRRRLQLVLDQYAVRDIPIEGSRLEFGRTEGAGKVCIENPSVSSQHAELVITASGAVLRDLQSTNGTFVNGQRIGERQLEDGDLLQFGACESHLFLYREARRRPAVLRDVELTADVMSVGRDKANRIQLDHPTVSARHAELRKTAAGFEIADLQSTNGTFVNGQRITRQLLKPRDRISLGAVQFIFDGAQMEQQSDGSRIRLSARGLTVDVTNTATGAPLRLLDDITLAIEPCEFVGLLGPAGAGKSTLMEALNGSRPSHGGEVLLNSANLYSEFHALRALMGYLPQEDILHRQLTINECLYYAARLRLPDDFSETEIWQRVKEVVQALELTEHADKRIAALSGGQRKRVSLGIELLSKPALLFADEPTAGQDPRSEMKLMQLFREIANRGSTVVINTHLLGSFSLLDKVAVLVRGKLAYFGGSQEMLPYFNARRPQEIFDKLQEKKPEEWAAQYRRSETFREAKGGRQQPRPARSARAATRTVKPRPRSVLRQWATLLSRQFRLKFKEKSTLAALLLPPVAIALLMALMKQSVNEPKVLFMIIVVALWFGCSSSVREIVDELPIYRRERQCDLSLSSYLGAKVVYLALVAAVQSLLFVGVLAGMGALDNHLPECFVLMWLMSIEGGLIGLLISSVFSTAEKALYVFPLTMIPQLLLAGLLIPVITLKPFYPVVLPENRVEVREVPPQLVPSGMGPALRYGLSPLMVSRWGLEALTDLFIHDNKDYSFPLLNAVSITLHPGDAARVREQLERMRTQGVAAAGPLPETANAFPQYLGILGVFALVFLGGTALALKWKENNADRH